VYRILISISLVLGALSVAADTAQDYFHRGAQYYIWSQKQKATNEIFTGLSLFPTDPQLNALAALIKKEEEQRQKQNQENQQKDPSNQDQKQQNQQQQGQQNQDQQKQDSSKQNQQAKQDQQQQAAQQAEDQEKKQQPAEQPASQQKEQSGETNEQAYAAGQMTPEQARQLLDAQKGDEKMLSFKPEGKPQDRSKPIRDW